MEISVEHMKIILAFAAGGLFALCAEFLYHVCRVRRDKQGDGGFLGGRQA